MARDRDRGEAGRPQGGGETRGGAATNGAGRIRDEMGAVGKRRAQAARGTRPARNKLERDGGGGRAAAERARR